MKQPGVKKKSRSIPKKKIASHKKISDNGLFPVVAIGASAGGLEPISKLLENLPSNLGMAYVILQHLSPSHGSILPELLHKKTKMKVCTVEDNMSVRPDNVYVIPPNAFMSIVDSKLKLTPRVKMNGANHPIDFFLSTLATVYRNKAIAVILSGSATDGTIGVQAIKAEGGITFAQDETATFHGMPQNAIDSGFIDFILSPREIAAELKDLKRSSHIVANEDEEIKIIDHNLRKIHHILLEKRGVDFSHYKQTTINRRIIRRMTLNHLTRSDDYIRLLRQENNNEVNLLYKDLLIVVTNFFRDPDVFNALAKKIFSSLVKQKKENEALRIWVPACATGEEAYSIAISLFEFLKDKAINTAIQIFATDLNETAIEKARLGIYSKAFLQNVPLPYLKKYFVKIDGHYQVIKSIRDICIFATHNLLQDPPFSRMDMISCQNIMIYLETRTQKKILQSFHYALKPPGFLILGKSETIGAASELFTQIDKELKIYTRQDVAHQHFDFSAHSQHFAMPNTLHTKKTETNGIEIDIEKETNKLLLSRYAPASVVVNKDLQIVRFNGDASFYLQPTAGKASLHLLKMVKDELVFELRNLTQKAKKENRAVRKEGLHVWFGDQSRELTLEAVPIRSSGRDPYFLILFRENNIPAPAAKKQDDGKKKKDSKDDQIITLEKQLKEARDQMKIMSEEFEATREELQSANEETLSSNEELQSINEELETSTEELQSTNEELTTINEELQHRNADLKESTEYSEAIIQTINEPLIVLNADMRVRTANQAFYSSFKTQEEDVQGFNFFEISNEQWHLPELKKMLDQVIHKDKSFHNFEFTHTFPKLGEKILLLSAMRLNTNEGKRNKVLLIIEDITQAKKSEIQIRISEERFRLLVQNAFDIVTVFSEEGTIVYESDSVERILGYKTDERLGKNIFKDPIVHPDDLKLKAAMFKKSKNSPGENIRTEFRLLHKNGEYKTIDAVCINLLDEPAINGIVANYHDVTEEKKLDKQREDFISIASHELRTPVTSIKGYVQIMHDMFSSTNDSMSMELVDKLDRQVDRLTNLIKDLLDVTKIREGQLQFRESSFDIDKLITEIGSIMQNTTQRHVIVMDLNAKKMITADRERIGQAITNLISNAIRYSPKADKIIVTSLKDGKNITVCVQDFGIGISPEIQKRVFDRFFRLNDKMTKTQQGLGLGLYITAEIIKNHGGTIRVTSEENKGSVFCFTLPVKYSPPPAR